MVIISGVHVERINNKDMGITIRVPIWFAILLLFPFWRLWIWASPDQVVQRYGAGTAGAVALSNGYTVSLDAGNAYTDEGAQIVDQNYKALWAELDVYSKNGELDGTVYGILDHDEGVPPALDAVLESKKMCIKDAKGKIRKYKKVNSVHTGDRESEDLIMANGRNVLSKDYIEEFGTLDEIVVFVVCEGLGRRITFWQEYPVTSSFLS